LFFSFYYTYGNANILYNSKFNIELDTGFISFLNSYDSLNYGFYSNTNLVNIKFRLCGHISYDWNYNLSYDSNHKLNPFRFHIKFNNIFNKKLSLMLGRFESCNHNSMFNFHESFDHSISFIFFGYENYSINLHKKIGNYVCDIILGFVERFKLLSDSPFVFLKLSYLSNRVLHDLNYSYIIYYENVEGWLKIKPEFNFSSTRIGYLVCSDLNFKSFGFYANNFLTIGFNLKDHYHGVSYCFEYYRTFITRSDRYTLRFLAWSLETSYIIFGGKFDYRCNVDKSKYIFNEYYGMLQFILKYNFISLDSQDVCGGKSKDLLCVLNWYLNENIIVSLNYIHSSQDRNRYMFGSEMCHHNILGFAFHLNI